MGGLEVVMLTRALAAPAPGDAEKPVKKSCATCFYNDGLACTHTRGRDCESAETPFWHYTPKPTPPAGKGE
jgi:hypothetical protein